MIMMDNPRNIGGGRSISRKMDAEDHDNHDDDHDDQDVEVPLPGFRFHPTDEELVGFYLRRKVHNKPITLDLIKLIDIYKYDPWDLPSMPHICVFVCVCVCVCIHIYIVYYIYVYIVF